MILKFLQNRAEYFSPKRCNKLVVKQLHQIKVHAFSLKLTHWKIGIPKLKAQKANLCVRKIKEHLEIFYYQFERYS